MQSFNCCKSHSSILRVLFSQTCFGLVWSQHDVDGALFGQRSGWDSEAAAAGEDYMWGTGRENEYHETHQDSFYVRKPNQLQHKRKFDAAKRVTDHSGEETGVNITFPRLSKPQTYSRSKVAYRKLWRFRLLCNHKQIRFRAHSYSRI